MEDVMVLLQTGKRRADCYIHKATAYRAASRIAEAIADCNRALALDSSSIPALSTRTKLLESIRYYPDCLCDLDHLKLLYNAILHNRKLSGPAWKQHTLKYRDVSSNLRTLTSKIQELRLQVASGNAANIDYYALIGLRRGCMQSKLERAHLLLSLRHRHDKSTRFVNRCEFVNDRDVDTIKDQARMSALLLNQLLQKGYSSAMASIMDEEAAKKQRQWATAAAAIQNTLPLLKSKLKVDTNSKMVESEQKDFRV